MKILAGFLSHGTVLDGDGVTVCMVVYEVVPDVNMLSTCVILVILCD